MDAQEKHACLQLALTPYIGPSTFLRLVAHFGSSTQVLQAPTNEVSPFFVKKQQVLTHWRSDAVQKAADDALEWENRVQGARLMFWGDDDYPKLLTEGLDPTPLLFLQGDVTCLSEPSLSIVGSRHATPQAQRITHDFAYALAELGVVITSGMAAGIDTLAHQGALAAKGKTIAIWGTGMDYVYPRSNKNLALEIAESGCLVSEFPLGTRAVATNFPRRNRLIAAQSIATLVVEAAQQSGSLITARLATEMGREVMAIPGSIDNPMSKGCHFLIKQGAKLVENLEDILQECPSFLQNRQMQPYTRHSEDRMSQKNHHDVALVEVSDQQSKLPELSQKMLLEMGYAPISADELIEKLGMTAADVYAELMELQLQGQVAHLPGARFQRVSSS